MNALSTIALLMPLTGGFNPHTKADCNTCPAPSMMPMMPPMMGPDIHGHRPCPPLGPPAQVLAVKFVTPAGTRITAFPGSPLGKTYANDALFGLRPGYLFKFELATGTAKLYPEVEVRGTLVLRTGMEFMTQYAAINFSQRDLDRASLGTLITKVIYLEDPDKAAAVKTTQDTPLELPDDNEELAVKAAMANGRLVAIVRMGNRTPTAEQLNAYAIPGTILLPGENYLQAPAMPAPLAWDGVALFDPILGPKFPHEECLTNGGDSKLPIGIRDNGELGNLNATDTAAEYTVGGKKKVVTSNTVCICAPRFVVRRVDVAVGGMATYQKTAADTQRSIGVVMNQRTPPGVTTGRERPGTVLAMVHPQIRLGAEKTANVSSSVHAQAVFATESVLVKVQSIEPEEVGNADGFVLVKSVDPKGNHKVGDEITITLNYANRTGKPATDVIVSDSLAARLEYIPGTAQSDRPVNITTTMNDAGSAAIRFELPGTLANNATGTIKFKAKIR